MAEAMFLECRYGARAVKAKDGIGRLRSDGNLGGNSAGRGEYKERLRGMLEPPPPQTR
jgi:hypothetical protein